MSNNIMQGLKVVELGTHVAIPYCTRTLADWGAEVIKIEPPKGESYRTIGRLFRTPFDEENNVFFTPYNVNKKSLCLDLKTQESIEILYKLLADADVFATNTRPAALEKMGLSLESIKEKFPRLIVVHLNGFGEKGEEKDRPGFDAAAYWCRAGAINEWTAAEDRPFKPFYGYGDAVTSSQLLNGILAALYSREKTGKGDIIKVSLFAAGLWTNVAGIVRGQDVCFAKPPLSHYSPLLPLDNFYKTKDDKWVLISEEHWEKRCGTYFDLIGKPEYKDNPEYNSVMGAIMNTPELVELFDENLVKYTSEELKKVLISIDTVFEFVASPEDVHKDKQAWDNDFLREVETVGGTKLVIPNNPISFDSQGLSDCRPAPVLGENTADILQHLGYSQAQIDTMNENKSIVAR
jgi:crotonobetainyl-CoA:carnitine CoA-transferase CaiB-like acyl-CoA transferase